MTRLAHAAREGAALVVVMVALLAGLALLGTAVLVGAHVLVLDGPDLPWGLAAPGLLLGLLLLTSAGRVLDRGEEPPAPGRAVELAPATALVTPCSRERMAW